jgi:hypothetical protein
MLWAKICEWNGDESVGVQDWLWRNAHCMQMNVEIIDFKAGLNPGMITYSSPSGQ